MPTVKKPTRRWCKCLPKVANEEGRPCQTCEELAPLIQKMSLTQRDKLCHGGYAALTRERPCSP